MLDFDLRSFSVFAENLRFPEGPAVLQDGTLLVPEIEGNSVAQLNHDGAVIKRFPCAAGPNGLAIGPDGAAYVMSDGGLLFEDKDGCRVPVSIPPGYVGGVIERLDIESGSIATLYEEIDGAHIGVLNDIIFNTEGYAYVVDTLNGKIYYFDPAGSGIRTVFEGLEAPNGMGLSPTGQDIFVSETYSGTIWRIPITAPGQLGEKVMHWTNDRAYGFDGLSVDAEGYICVASLGPSGITVVSAKGEKVGLVELPESDSCVTNIVFAGEDLRDAYICSAGRGKIYKIRWPHPGQKMHFAG